METTITVPAAMMGDPDLMVTLIPDGIITEGIEYGKPRYRFTVTDGTYTFRDVDLCGWEDAEGMVRSACGFLSYYVECHGPNGYMTNIDDDPLPNYSDADWAFLVRHSETLGMGSEEPGDGDND